MVKAPTDPEKNRGFFFTMKEKEFYGKRTELYQDACRLPNSAEVTGNVHDKEMLKLLETVDGFKKLVHSIGVSIEMEDKDQTIDFRFQFYGKKDQYGGGANIYATIPADGSEQRLYLKDVEWTEDDNVPGQIILTSEDEKARGFITMRLYLNDGFEAPEQEEESPVDVDSKEYKDMISNSLMQIGNTKRIGKLIEKAKAGKDVTIAYIGGSITQGAGATPINTECYAYKSFVGFKKLLGDGDNIHYVKAGVGGTPSELGMLRFDRDVTNDGKIKPDLVIVEFAVNDEGDETQGDCYESLVRKILKLDYEPAVILLFSVFADDFNLQDRLKPVGIRYELPMVSVKDSVVPQFYDRSKRIITKNQFFYDMFHPTNLGHTIMADCLINLMETIMEKAPIDKEYNPDFEAKPAIGNSFDDVILVDKKDNTDMLTINPGGFVYTDTVLQSVERELDLELTPEFPYNWMYDGSKNTDNVFTVDVECKALVVIMKDTGEGDGAVAKAYVDGEFVRDLDPYVNRWCHCNPLILVNQKTTAAHHVEIRVESDDIRNKFTILGFGLVK